MNRPAVITATLLLALPAIVFAQGNFVPLVGIPGIDSPEKLTLENYVNALYLIAISIAAFLAVGRLIFAGLQYILSDVVTSKENAKRDIRNSIIGLLVVIGAVLLLETINPQLTNLNALGNLGELKMNIDRVYVIDDNSDVPSGLLPQDDEILKRIKCTINQLEIADCSEALKECRDVHKGHYRTTTPYQNSLFCYVPKETTADPETCAGYFEPRTRVCYDHTDVITLGPEFDFERNDLRQQECTRLGGTRYEDNICYKDY